MNPPLQTERGTPPEGGPTGAAGGGYLGHTVPEWTLGDHLSAMGVRLNIRRMNSCVLPGLYTLGAPGPDAPVLVSANYKLSFDHLRRALAGRSAWILVLDTRGINVWCAAGKGTFGTEELIRKVGECQLSERVVHRRLIVPQLGAPGVAAHEVRRRTGFAVTYGPVRAADIPAFLQAGLRATPAMRRVRFPWHERLAVAPLELVLSFKTMMLLALVVALPAGLSGTGSFGSALWHRGGPAFLLSLLTWGLAGLLGPLLLPWLPTRSFSLKGACLGVALGALGLWAAGTEWTVLGGIAWILMAAAGTSHLLLNFTGSTTFTSPSGVRREVRAALPVQIAIGALGLAAWTAAGFLPGW